MLFRLIRSFVVFCVRQFFSRVKIAGASPVERGPLLIVANHPNYMFDSMVVMTSFRRDLWFLAKATLFHNPLMRMLLTWLHVIPVYRRQDDPSEVSKNDETFRAATAHLRKGRALCIFPEGLSKLERKLSPIKTGAARIALQAEEQSGYRLDLQIQPVGITYTDQELFRSALTLTIGEPIRIRKYREEFERNPRDTVRDLTSEIEESLRELTVEVESTEDEILVEQIARLYASAGQDVDDRERFELVVRNLKSAPKEARERREELSQKLENYLSSLRAAGFDFHESLEPSYDPFFIALLSPLVALGYVVHLLPYRLIGPIAARMSHYDVQAASFKLTVGIFLLPVWYLGLSLLVWIGSGALALAVLTFLLAVISGYYVNNYLHQVRLGLALLLGSRCLGLNLGDLRDLKKTRDELIEVFEKYRTH